MSRVEPHEREKPSGAMRLFTIGKLAIGPNELAKEPESREIARMEDEKNMPP